MDSVAVRKLEVSSAGRISMTIESCTSEKSLYFDVPSGSDIHPDAVAASAALILSKQYNSILLDFPVSEKMREQVGSYCQAEVKTSTICAPESLPSSGVTGLAFSGGFDSLSARDFLPGAPQLVSLDFGGAFSRERNMFHRFNSVVVRTNLVEIGLNRNSWAFMAVGNRLLRSTLGLTSLSFGTVLEARDKYVTQIADQRQPSSSALTDLTGMPIFNPVLGLTEVATAIYVSQVYPDIVGIILSSVANPGEEKSYRKSLLLEAAALRAGKPTLPRLASPKTPQFKWGDSYALDFLALYLIKHVGVEAVQASYAETLPAAAEALASKLQLSFYERVNPNFYLSGKRQLVGDLLRNMAYADIFPYSNIDFDEFSQVASYLLEVRKTVAAPSP